MRFLRRLILPVLGLLVPLILLILGVIFDIKIALFYIGAIIWFGLGIFVMAAIYE